MAAALEELGYEPLLVKDVPDALGFEHYDLLQKAVLIGSVSRFTVIDDTELLITLLSLRHSAELGG
jgi:hypothetical protein